MKTSHSSNPSSSHSGNRHSGYANWPGHSGYSKRSGARRVYASTGKAPVKKWPFPARRGGGKPGLSKGSMAADVCLVALWGASIPCMMWLGAAGGF